jgi:tetratricopeptide (TPR) repeat protein
MVKPGKRVPLSLVLVLLLLSVTAPVGAQQDEPAWLALEQGHQHFDEGAFGDALRSYQTALAEAGIMPEAELGIARVYAAQADDVLAVRFYRQALEQEEQFDVPEVAHLARYELAEIYRRQRRPEAYEEILLQVVADDSIFSDPEEESTRNRMRDVLLAEGLDRLLVLYRLQELFSTEAHQRLAEHYVEGGREVALYHAMFAVVKILSEAISAYRERYFDYEFQSVLEFHGRLGRQPLIREYLQEAGLYRSIYFLGEAVQLYQPRSGVAREIMETLVQLGDTAGPWAGRAQRVLR